MSRRASLSGASSKTRSILLQSLVSILRRSTSRPPLFLCSVVHRSQGLSDSATRYIRERARLLDQLPTPCTSSGKLIRNLSNTHDDQRGKITSQAVCIYVSNIGQIEEDTDRPSDNKDIAAVVASTHRMALYARFFSARSVDDTVWLNNPERICPGDHSKTRAMTLLHELVHYVSHHRFAEFRQQINSPCAQSFLDTTKNRNVTDVRVCQFVSRCSNSDQDIARWFRLEHERLGSLRTSCSRQTCTARRWS